MRNSICQTDYCNTVKWPLANNTGYGFVSVRIGCCIYHKPRRFGESSDSDSDDDCCGGGGAGGCGSGGGAGGADGKAHKHKQHQQGHSHLPGETEHCRGHTNHCYRAANDRSHEHDAGPTGAAGGSAGSGSAWFEMKPSCCFLESRVNRM